MGSEFIPSLDEGDIALHAMRVPGTSLTQSTEMEHAVEKKILEFPEVKTVFSKIGTPEIATDPMPPNVADCFVMLKPRKEWPNPRRDKAELVEAMQAGLNKVPGNNYEFTQPIQMRFNELISGVRSDVGVKVFGDDMDVLLSTANEVSAVLSGISGASDVKVEQVTGLPLLTVNLDRKKVARYGLKLSEVQDLVAVALNGMNAGEVFEGDRRHEIIVRLPEALRSDMEALKRLPIPLPPRENDAGHRSLVSLASLTQGEKRALEYVPLSAVADFDLSPGPNQISREDGKRRVVATANVRGRDLGSFVEEAQAAINQKVKLPAGYWIDWGGQFEQLISASKRLKIVTPIALLIIFLLLFMTLGNMKDSLLVFTGIPLALTGGILFLLRKGNTAFHFRRNRIHRAFRGRSAQWTCYGIHDQNAEIGGEIPTRLHPGRLHHPAPACSDDRSRGFTWIRANGPGDGYGSRSPAPLGHRRYRGHPMLRPLLTLLVLPVLYGLFHRKEDRGMES